MRIEIARLYARTRNDGSVTLSGKMGYNGRLRILPNPDKIEGDDRSPDFIAWLEEVEPKDPPSSSAPRSTQQFTSHQQTPRAFKQGRDYVGESQ